MKKASLKSGFNFPELVCASHSGATCLYRPNWGCKDRGCVLGYTPILKGATVKKVSSTSGFLFPDLVCASHSVVTCSYSPNWGCTDTVNFEWKFGKFYLKKNVGLKKIQFLLGYNFLLISQFGGA